MSVAKVSEIISASSKGFDDAIEKGIKRASKTLRDVKSVWISDQSIDVEDGKAVRYKVCMKVTFVLKD
jgi:dodecin